MGYVYQHRKTWWARGFGLALGVVCVGPVAADSGLDALTSRVEALEARWQAEDQKPELERSAAVYQELQREITALLKEVQPLYASSPRWGLRKRLITLSLRRYETILDRRTFRLVLEGAVGALTLTARTIFWGDPAALSTKSGGSTLTRLETCDGMIRRASSSAEWSFLCARAKTPLKGVTVLGLLLVNRGSKSLELDWNRTVIVDEQRRVRRVIHGGVPLAERDREMMPSLVPPGALLEDFVVPAHLISAPEFFLALLKPGDALSLVVSLREEGKSVEETFRFRVVAG